MLETATVRSMHDLSTCATNIATETNLRWLFRGMTHADWDLRPSVHREYDWEGERSLTQEFRARAGMRRSRQPRYGDYADWLALMQHYRLPTRLLDWSHSALIAAYFAVDHALPHARPRVTNPESDAIIWALCPSRLNEKQGLKGYIYPLNSADLEPLVVSAFYIPDKRDYRAADAEREVVAAMAVESDIRMQVQRGAFTIHATRSALNQLPGCEDWLRRWVIPRDAIVSFAREVDALGLGLADVFPDLDNLAIDLACRVPKISSA